MGNEIFVTPLDPFPILDILTDDPIMSEVAMDARQELERVISSLE
jgi:hypothetical protein